MKFIRMAVRVCAVAAGLLLFFTVAGWAVLASIAAFGYLRDLHTEADTLQTYLEEVSTTERLPVFSDAGTSSVANLRSLDTIQQHVIDARDQLAQFDTTAGSLRRIPLASVLPPYHQALAEQDNARTIVAQTQDELDQYDALRTFLQHFFVLDAQFTAVTGHINATSNITSLSSSTASLRTNSDALRAAADSLGRQPPPYSFQPVVTQMQAAYRQAADGVGALADGLDAGNDQQQTAALQQIEQATQTHDKLLADLPSTAYQQSYVLREIRELSRKTNSILAANTSGD